jgi:hypothetical protein
LQPKHDLVKPVSIPVTRCPVCDYHPLFALANYLETDVNDKPTTDYYVPDSHWSHTFPLGVLIIQMSTAIGNLLWGKAKVAKGRAKVRRARAEVLPRSPKSLICPHCYEVLEKFE